MEKKKLTFALVTRLQYCEAPFLNEFLSYYDRLGVDCFYLVNTEPKYHQNINSIIAPEFRYKIKLYKKRQQDRLNTCASIVVPDIKETYTLHLDMDEFLYLDGNNLEQFARTEKLHLNSDANIEHQFKWIMCPYFKSAYTDSIKDILDQRYFFSYPLGKSMARTENIKIIKSHFFDFYGEKSKRIYSQKMNNMFIFHVSHRGIFDCINKMIHDKFNTLKKSKNTEADTKDLLLNEESDYLPNRFILAAFQDSFHSHTINLQYTYPKLEHKTDIHLLREITLSSVRNYIDAEVSEDYIERVVRNKLERYKIPDHMIDLYNDNKISFLDVLDNLSTKTTP